VSERDLIAGRTRSLNAFGRLWPFSTERDYSEGYKIVLAKKRCFFSRNPGLKTHDLGIWTLFFLAFVLEN